MVSGGVLMTRESIFRIGTPLYGLALRHRLLDTTDQMSKMARVVEKLEDGMMTPISVDSRN